MRKYARRVPQHSYTKEEIRFLEQTVPGHSYEETRQLFNERFGLVLNPDQLKGKIKRMGLKNGIDPRFGYDRIPYKPEKGVIPPQLRDYHGFCHGHTVNSMPEGSERVESDGYVVVKIRDGEKWKPKHVIIWEEVHGPVPKGHVIIFADKNKQNFSLDNLLMISKSELFVMNRYGLIFLDKDLTRTGKLIADIMLLISKRKKQLKGKSSYKMIGDSKHENRQQRG
jgi:hypothetical protein